MRVVMVGTGYVGLVTGTCLSEVGHDVTCVDLSQEKIRLLKDGVCPIFEPGLEGMIRRNVEHERLHFTTELAAPLAEADMVFIAVGTPEGEDGSADLKYVKAVAESLGRLVNRDMVVVVKSTVPVGTCDIVEEIIDRELDKRKVKFQVVVASNPEFLKEGDAIADFMKPDRVVVGLNDFTAETSFRDLYRPFIMDDQGKLLLMDRRSSELTKYGANAMLATRISFMNEMALLCERLGANIDKVRLGIGSDARIGRKFLYAGPGYGGSCFPKDVSALLKTSIVHGVELKVLNAVTEANDRQKNLVFQKIAQHFRDLAGRRVAVWGLTFKPGTDDVRESPATVLIRRLLDAGAFVIGHDPQGQSNFAKEFGEHERLTYADSAYDAIRGADALVLVTEWSEYKRPNWDKVGQMMASRALFDLRNQYESYDLISRGFHYECVGRPDSRSLPI
ncbi:MAG: UDP-glucose/GDP-mannose dehydrogenase family protein [Pseudobdellovibrionaceae bacterium]|uniref:UDP-glucose dehydrogenase family protein n=1 Tax=Oligoflexus sp. TaxID=1971216 RepID=UPI0027C236D4|nr:UDP-glucose/GDP-mannose dehydrogenase family protein [Oligoflexus sp.]MDQ3230392.1 UDP-glucose/GDP-mannose dehydrogenase family protein [Pseudobdellovibrionaceae bacterium]HYX33060.1 UDP-glucose/GDP-mannose dehydrogenase family protein [Oligoflexus sp.]